MFGDETVEFVVVFQPYMESIRFKFLFFFLSYMLAVLSELLCSPISCILCRLSLSLSLCLASG